DVFGQTLTVQLSRRTVQLLTAFRDLLLRVPAALVLVICAVFAPFFLFFALHRRCIRRRSLGPLLGLQRCVGQALATEAIAECIRSGGVGEAESNIELLGLVPTPSASDWDASVTVERINL